MKKRIEGYHLGEECDGVPANSEDRILCEVWHYNREYSSEASYADLQYEIGKTPKTEPCILKALWRGASVVTKHRVNKLIEDGLLETSELGGIRLTAKGKSETARLQDKYGVVIK